MSKKNAPTFESVFKKLKSLEKEVLELQSNELKTNESDDYISFKAGTKYFTTLRSTIDKYPSSMLYLIVNGSVPSKMVNGAYYIDMNPTRFEFILDYMITSLPPSMTPREDDNFQEDILYFQLPYVKALTLIEKKWKQQIDEWLTYELYEKNADTAGGNRMILLDDNHLFYNNFMEITHVYRYFTNFCESTFRSTITPIQFSTILRYLGLEVKASCVNGFFEQQDWFKMLNIEDWHIVSICLLKMPYEYKLNLIYEIIQKYSHLKILFDPSYQGHMLSQSTIDIFKLFDHVLKTSEHIQLEMEIREEWKTYQTFNAALLKLSQLFDKTLPK
jgi:hypothetical protein